MKSYGQGQAGGILLPNLRKALNVGGNVMTTKSDKKISWTLATLSTLMAIFLFFHLASDFSFIERLLIALIILVVPALIAVCLGYIYQRLLNISYWAGSSLMIGFCFLVVIYRVGNPTPDNSRWYIMGNGQDTIKHQYSAIRFYEMKLGDSYKPVFIENSYLEDSNNGTTEYVVKQIYRIGDKNDNNYYIAKVLVSNSYLVIKEYIINR